MSKSKTKKTVSSKKEDYPNLKALLPVVERVAGKTLDIMVANAIDGELLKAVFGEELDLEEVEKRLGNICLSSNDGPSAKELLKNTESLLSKIKKSV